MYPYPNRGYNVGIERSIEGITHALAKKGHNINVITTFTRNGGYLKEEENNGIKIYRVNDLRNIIGKAGCLLSLDQISINYFLREHMRILKNSDIIHTYIPYLLHTPEIPLVSTFFHEEKFPNLIDYLYLPMNKYLWKRTYKRCDAIISISDFSAQYLLDIGVPKNKIHTAYMGVDIEKFHPMENADKLSEIYKNMNILLFVGPYQNRKGLKYLIQALPQVLSKYDNTVLILVGKDHKKYLNDMVLKLGLNDHVIFEGMVPEQKLPIYYNSCDIFVFPSELEGFGIVLIEAMACKKTVITTNVTAIPEVVGDAGIMIEPRNPKILANVIIELLENNEKRENLENKALVRVQNKFSWDIVTNKLENVYKNILR